MKRVLIAIGIAFIFSSFCANPARTPAAPEYPDKAAGLKKMIQDLLKAEKDGNQQKVKEYAKAAKLPNSDEWFKSVFGERFGPSMAKDYQAQSQFTGKTLNQTLANALRDKMTDIEAHRFDKPCDPDAGDGVYPVLVARAQPFPMYQVKLMNGTYWTELFAFVYVDGVFRYVPQPKVPQINTVRFVKKASDEGSGSGDGDSDDSGTTPPAITHRVPPMYPDSIGNALTDSVKMNILISADGSVQEMYPISGRCSFVDATEKAVKKWTFSPGKSNGTPYESWFLLSQEFTRSGN